MATSGLQRWNEALFGFAERQHGVVARGQLLDVGLSCGWIDRALAGGRLHLVWRGVYAIGRPQLTQYGRWMAAVLRCGSGAALSDRSAAALWGMLTTRQELEVAIPIDRLRRVPGIVVRRRRGLAGEVTRCRGIPVTSPVCTLIDISKCLGRGQLEAAINEADKADLIDPEGLRIELQATRRHGTRVLREILDRRTFSLTDSALERRFLPIARRAGLTKPQTGARLNGFKVDFYWPELGLVVETDGLRYHRTPAQQARDRMRDQAHTAAGLTPLRFTHAQVRYESDHVQATLAAVARRLGGRL
jgi:very-short-patch-repair endonuclease